MSRCNIIEHCQGINWSTLCLFFAAQDLNEQTSLYLAALGGYVDLVEYLLSFRVHELAAQEV